MATVYINGRFLTQTMTGVQRYARETLTAIDGLLHSGREEVPFELELLTPPDATALALRAIRTRSVGPLRGHAWEQFVLPFATGGEWLLSFGPTGPIAKERQIITMHDAATRAVPDAYSTTFRTWNNLLLPALARRAAYMMTVSEFSRDEVIRHFGARPATTRVSGEGWQHITRVESDPTILARHGLTPQRYVLAVSSVTRHKNFAVIVRAVERLTDRNIKVVIVGGLDLSVFGRLDPKVLDGVTQTGYVTDGELCSLYGGAAAFIYPSLYEGFGIPPLEAMALGCPVIASSAAAIPETCGDAALYFEPQNEEALAAAIVELTSDSTRRAYWIARGQARLAAHHWDNSARQHLSLLRDAVKH